MTSPCVVKADKAHAELQRKWKPTKIKELKLTAKPLGRQARLIYLPAHAVSYQYGQGFTSSGERHPYTFQVCGRTQITLTAVLVAAIGLYCWWLDLGSQ